VNVVTTVAMVMLLRDFGPCLKRNYVFTTLDFPVILDGQLTSFKY
jgi:hypothetical protein